MPPTIKNQGKGSWWKKPSNNMTKVKLQVKDDVHITEYWSGSFRNMRKNLTSLYPGKKVVDPRLLHKYSKGEGVEVKAVGRRNSYVHHKLERREKKIQEAEEETARTEVLLTESSGYLEAEEDTVTSHITQKDIKDAVDITSAAKSFDLNLRHFGPYKMQFTQNGRHLVLGGRKGHLAAMDWITKKLLCEINVMESIHDICWLHTEQMMVAAQKKWVYMYDNNGIELHCIKKLNRVLKLEFLPYHFLLCAGNDTGFLSWLDVTLGKEVIQIFTHKGRLEIMCQNPYNAVLCCGHPNGTVTMWTPNSQEPVASVFCHRRPIRAVEFDPSGRYMATSGDRRVKIWDARNLGEHLQCYSTRSVVSHLSFSQRRLLAMSMDNVVEVYQNVTTGGASEAYMRHNSGSTITDMQFCPYEDILGISTYHGYSSLIIPGAGEPNFDALEANPYVSVSGRREAEVKSLLSKVPADLITLDPLSIGQVDLPRLQEKLDAKNALLYVRKPKIDFTPRYRMKGKSNSAQKFKRKQKMKEGQQRDYLKAAVLQRENFGIGKTKKIKKIVSESSEILDRFKPKEKKLL